jgi:hypothetical protein
MQIRLLRIEREGDPAFSGSPTRLEGPVVQTPDHRELLRNALNHVLPGPATGHKGRLMGVRPRPFGGRAAAAHR